jgi:hypothetical protein
MADDGRRVDAIAPAEDVLQRHNHDVGARGEDRGEQRVADRVRVWRVRIDARLTDGRDVGQSLAL